MRTAAITGLVTLLSLPIFAFACSGAAEDDGAASSFGEPGGTGGTGGGGIGGGLGEGGGLNIGGNDPGGPTGCSSDLQHVVDENGNVVETCPADQGCSEGECISACEAAAASKGSIGCDYYAPTVPFYRNGAGGTIFDGPCHAVFVANTWGRAAKLTVQRNGQALDVTSFGYIPSGSGASTTYAPLPAEGLPPGEVAVLFLSHRPGVQHSSGTTLECPRPPAVLLDTAVHGSGRSTAFQVASDTPLTAYDILPYGGALSYLPSAAHLFPRSTWGDNYYAVAPHASTGGVLWMLFVGNEDGTTVEFSPTSTLPGGPDVPTAQGGQAVQFTLNAGEVVQWAGGDPSGAVIQASSPIGLWTGTTYLSVATATSPGAGGRDSAHQQLAPISAMGSEYVGAGVVTRLASMAPESVPYRLLGVVEGTTLSWDPEPPAGAPTTLGGGQIVEFETTQLFSVRAQDEEHPFVLTQYLAGMQVGVGSRPGCGGQSACALGDEEWVLQLPPGQFLRRYVFFTDPTYGTTNLVITRVRGADGAFSDVTLSCLGTVTGWQAVGTAGDYEVAHVDLTRGFVGAAPECETSRHEASSEGAFGVTVWGTDHNASYAYPAGGNVGAINSVVIPPTPQ
ncbi:IgGFc-binding protein [Chondromyces apiculatus]|uniref:IgGFc-binding protein N-terminal domain-containing protein n=1 Tax=Chondromyces apiculatus DSM 436 TaxID=1192034 RepID=A0A017TH38_9BACT|nr:IgGFc-binding protein [Chondromyces apiculatus]EYF08534.1 Hypothetical protein CAP_4064 [Chondromyces apiculatus DSM 436]